MKIKWQWFLGGRVMYWITIILFIMLIFSHIITYMIDPTTKLYMTIQDTDSTSIKNISEQYMESLGITINKPIRYRFVKYRHTNHFKSHNSSSETVLLGTFHEWNSTYYIDISVNLYHMSMIYDIVIHETRHMIVQELKNEKIIDLSEYSEEIAQENDQIYNELFNYSVKLLKKEQKNGK